MNKPNSENSGLIRSLTDKLPEITLAKQLIILLIGSVLIGQLIIVFIFATKIQNRLDHFRSEELTRILQQTSQLETEQQLKAYIEGNNRSDKDQIYVSTQSITEHQKLREEKTEQVTINQTPGTLYRYNNFLLPSLSFWFSDAWKDCEIKKQGLFPPQHCPFEIFEFILKDGRYLQISSNNGPNVLMLLAPALIIAIISLAIIFYLVSYIVRRITLPLQHLNQATRRFGRGETFQAVEPEGAAEIRQTITDFNDMQQRISRFVQDRTRMLAAISHDLRTPITSLRLRTEFIADDQLRSKMIRTLEDMDKMVESCLAFTRQENIEEARVNIDLYTLLQELAEDSSFIEFHSPLAHCHYHCQRINLTRALVNLLDNAVHYGKQANISLQQNEQSICIDIEDQGPGIPAEKMQDVFEPFVRLDQARNTEGANVGLGLSIARTIIHKHGGDIGLVNTSQGLRASVQLPR